MGRIPRHVIDAIRDATDIVEVVQKHVRLQRQRTSWVGLCPFHQEKTPSFHVVPAKNLYHCFGCQAGGDVFRFLMELEGLSFIEAVKELAAAAGIPIEEEELSPEQRRALRQRATWYDVLEAAAQFFESTLWTRPEGEPGRAYLERRQLSPEMTRKARLGFAPAGWSSLLDHLHRQGFDPALAAQVGLARERQGGNGFYDAFRERVMFPICDERGRVIAFGGRLLEGDGPKYINSPETRIYEKSKVLYGLNLARMTAQRNDRIIVVEGYFDVLAMHEAGFTETVATCGTALTRDHMEKIRRTSSRAIVLLDSDTAGMRAAERALPLFVGAKVTPMRLQLPGAKDPDELVRESGPEAMQAAIARAEPLLEWVVQYKLSNLGSDALARERALDELLPVLADVPGDLLSRVAARIRIDERTLLARVHDARQNRSPDPDAAPPGPPPDTGWRPHRDMVHLLWLLVHRYDQVADLLTRADPSIIGDHPGVQQAVARLLSGEPVASVLPEVADDGVRRTLSAIVARDRLYGAEEAALAMCEILEKLGRPLRESELARLTSEAQAAERARDWDRYTPTLRAQAALRTRIQALDTALRRKDVTDYVRLLDEESREKAAPSGVDG